MKCDLSIALFCASYFSALPTLLKDNIQAFRGKTLRTMRIVHTYLRRLKAHGSYHHRTRSFRNSQAKETGNDLVFAICSQ
jgi:hypothetical protein